MRHESDPGRLLHKLLDRHERRSDRSRRIIERPGQAFADSGARDRLTVGLAAACDAGAVTLEWDRDAPHLIARVILDDAERLYRHLNRVPASDEQDAASAALSKQSAKTDIAVEIQTSIRAAWQEGRRYLGLGPAALGEAVALIRAADAAFTALPGGALPLRTRSARLLGDSKMLERQISKLLAHLKQSGRLDPELERDEALEELGLAKFPQPLLIAGPVSINGLSAGALAYLGLPPEAVQAVTIDGAVRSLLAIENLESFHRHVRECRGESDVVVYCGGFPAQGVIRALRHMVEHAGLAHLHHWGDIDAGGVRIARFLERSLPVPVLPHLMDAAVAMASGQPGPPAKELASIVSDSAFHEIARFLSSDRAHYLEQEVLDPRPIGNG